MALNQLSGKRILLIRPAYYCYERLIEQELIRQGATVVVVESNAPTKGIVAAKRDQRIYRERLLSASKSGSFDICFFINLFCFEPDVAVQLRKNNPSASLILYLWDNLKEYPWKQHLSLFDKVYSFDPVDAAKHQLEYFPNFYPVGIRTDRDTPIEFDLCFIGSFQAHRLQTLEQLKAQADVAGKKYFFYLYLPPRTYSWKYNPVLYNLLRWMPLSKAKRYCRTFETIYLKQPHPIVKHTRLSLEEVSRYIQQSRCIIDLPYPAQTGSSHRVVNAIASGCKVITTNPAAELDLFYDPRNIKVITMRDTLHIEWNWISKKQPPVAVEQFRLDNWLLKLLA